MVLSQEEVVRLIDAAPNRLYRMIVDDALCDRRTPHRSGASEGRATSTASAWWSISARARAARPRCNAHAEAARGTAHLLAVEEATWVPLSRHRWPRGVDQSITAKIIWTACRIAADARRSYQGDPSAHPAAGLGILHHLSEFIHSKDNRP